MDRVAPVASESTQVQGATFHGGRLIARRLKAHGVSKLFTLSGGHLFSIYDGCREEGIEIVDVRHESTAAFAAEGWAKVTREPGVCALTAGPGVTNGMSAMASAQANHSPMVVLGGRAPALRWGQGSLQEIDHVPFVRPLTKLAATAGGTEEIAGLVDLAFQAALAPHGGPAFVDFPLDYVEHGDRAGRRAAQRGRAAGDHGRHRPLLGPRRARAADARRGVADSRISKRPSTRVRAGRPRAFLLACALAGAQGR
jgi:acetolactate synthase-1/2/3 large subunit